MALVDKIYDGAIFVDQIRFDNTVGSVVFSAEDTNTGELIPDVYTLTLSSVSGGTATVTVSTASVNNPWNGVSVPSVDLDEVTVYDNIVPGLNLVFDSAGANSDEAEVSVGQYFGTISASGISAGETSDEIRHEVTNSGPGYLSEVTARVLRQAIQVEKIGNVFSRISNFAELATEKVAGGGSQQIVPYVMTIANTAGAGASKTCDLEIDGVVFSAGTIRDRVTGALVSGTGLKAIDDQSYMVVSGPLNGFVFNIDPDCVNADEANVLIFLNRYLQIAEDISGTAGEFGQTDVLIGDILPTESGYYWSRVLVPGSSNSQSNPYLANVALTGMDSESADW